MHCFGRNLADHCCYVNGEPCKFLESNKEPGMLWSCQLRRENGSWAAAIADPRYMEGDDAPGKAFEGTAYKNCAVFQCRECEALESGKITEEEFLELKTL